MTPNTDSILWSDSTPERDRALVSQLVDTFMVGTPKHKQACVQKILDSIGKKSWQKQYKYRTFIFSALYAETASVVEIGFTLNAQALDALYFLLTDDAGNTSFATKVEVVFEKIYREKMREETAKTLRILRNNVMHTGSITGIKEKLQDYEVITLDKFQADFEFPDTERAAIALAAGFNYLIRDLILRVMGLDWDDLAFNGNPPSKLDYFVRQS